MKIGRIIMNLRKDMGWSQMDLAKYTGLSQVMIGKYERGDSMPGFDSACKIANALGVSILVFTGEKIPEKQQTPQDLINKMEEINDMPQEEREKIISVINALIRDYKIRAIN
jgi:transcriptional regulator with XRE-family HTH domain